MLNKAYPLRYSDLLLLRQLRGQPSLARSRVVNRNRDLLLKLKYFGYNTTEAFLAFRSTVQAMP